jgi:uncharacterized membrane protein
MKWFLIGVGTLHALFMVLEMFPWASPVLLNLVSRKRLASQPFSKEQQEVVATIVHNAGIYNAILAGGLFWAGLSDPLNRDVARVLLAGAASAGVFGTMTLKSPFTALQAVLGIVGLFRL